MTNWNVGLVVCAVFGSAACGTSEDTGGGGGGGAYRGEATLTIGSEVWEFDNFGCAFGHAATESDLFSFSSSSIGMHSTGARVQMQAEIQDPTTQGRYEGDGVLYTVYINDIQDFENPAVDFESTTEDFGRQGESGMTMITLDGDKVSATGLFDDRLTVGDFTQVAGTLEGICGDQSRR